MNPLSANMIGLFLMNRGTGTAQGTPAQDTNLVDMTTANPAGNVPPTWEVADPSILFNGGASLNCYLDAGVDLLFNDMPTSKITIVAKVLVNALTLGGICEKNDGKPPNSDSGFIFAMDNTGALRVTVELTANSMRITTGAVVVVGQWMQLAFTWDGTQYNAGTTTAPSSAATIYVNQVAQANAAAQDGHGTLDATKLSNNQPFRIGNVSYDFPGSFYGKMAYMAVYKGRILTTAEMAGLEAALPIKAG
jgi:Concanavalin A-like lectin/glucanases superfamily